MRAAAILGLGTSESDLRAFGSGAATTWAEGLPSSAEEADAVVIFGGDGTVHRHLAALVRLQLPVLVVPSGSGNDFARALNLRSVGDSLKAWRGFEAGKVRPRAMDLGVIRPDASPGVARYFCCVAGCGLDAATARRANQMPRWLRGHGGYVLALLPALVRLPAYAIRIRRCNGPGEHRTGEDCSGERRTGEHHFDGPHFDEHREEARPTLLAAFANTQFFGDGMRIAPQADASDGQLDICRIGKMNAIELAGMFPTVYFGRHLGSPSVEYWKDKRVRVESDVPLEIYADGEFVCETPAEISVAPGALRVIAG
jgi:diacylglycerol kinase (ATP)